MDFLPRFPTGEQQSQHGHSPFWYLIYRTADELERLGVQAGIPGDLFSISTERLGVDLFLIARKPPG